MLSKNDIKRIRSLSEKKERQQQGLFIAEGDKTCRDIIGSKIRINSIYATADWLEQYTQIIPEGCDCVIVTQKELEKLSRHNAPQQVIMLVHIPKNTLNLDSGSLTLVLDNLQDPGNLGTIIRTADWYGIQNIFCSSDTVDAYNPKVVDSTMGSIGRVNIVYGDIAELLNKYENIPVYGALLNGESVYTAPLQTPAFLIIGNEGKGISKEIVHLINRPLHIPGKGGAESLNAAVATAILCDHFEQKTTL
ncbi:MAG: RNA methyltransferase [Bacteroidia bacterium]|nr:RNA methyltransferase [Bacteroidia bacterium]MBP7260697.1 RNA methyltransferase [Bacteroidia bacterium]MBP9179601.1 RNA methyltransferase [Bacteroidia bacterium]MBP9724551.1 RNA methyltransferase [Bacteroidia bacterium]